MKPRILILTSNSYRKVYFANEIGKNYDVVGIVVEQKFTRVNRLRSFLSGVNYNPLAVLKKMYYKARLAKIDRRYEEAEVNMLLAGDRCADFGRGAGVLKTDDINSRAVVDFIKRRGPNIILVSGPSLVRRHIIEMAPAGGIINMHTGLSPYYRGGPCTFWCLFNGELECLGVTIHHLTAGIDSGDIVLSERETLISPADNEATLDCKVIRRGAALMIKAVRMIFDGAAPRVPQWQKGKNYLHKYFTPQARLELERRLKNGLVAGWLAANAGRQFGHIREVR